MSTSTVTVDESWDAANLTLTRGSFRNGESNMSVMYVVENAENEQVAAKEAYEQAPSKIEDHNGKKRIPKKSATVVERCGSTTWKVQVDYGYNTASSDLYEDDYNSGEDDIPDVSVQCSSTTIHVIRPYYQTCVYKSASAPAITDAMSVPIGWNGKRNEESEAAGVDVESGEIRETYTRLVSYEMATSTAWKRRMAAMKGCVNSNSFKGWLPGEVKFLSWSYATPLQGVDKVKVTFEFLIRPNEINASVCGHSIGNVYGHEYVWAVEAEKNSNGSTVKEIKYIFKSGVSKLADFSTLGL